MLFDYSYLIQLLRLCQKVPLKTNILKPILRRKKSKTGTLFLLDEKDMPTVPRSVA